MICGHCGKENKDEARFCRGCGKEVSQIKKCCSACGNAVNENAKFCPSCGKEIETVAKPTKKICSNCGAEHPIEVSFCDQCGKFLATGMVSYVANDNNKIDSREEIVRTGNDTSVDIPFFKLSNVSLYEGERKVGVAKATGELTVFKNRLELKRQWGNAAANVTLVTMAIERNKAKKLPPDIFLFSDILSVHRDNYLGVWSSLIVKMKNGRAITLVSNVGQGEKLNEVCTYINKHC